MRNLKNEAIECGEILSDFIWGSYQYQVVAGMYKLLIETAELETADKILQGQIFDFGELGPYSPWTEENAAICRQGLLEDHQDEAELREQIKGISTIEELLIGYRNCAYDLWCAIGSVMGFLYHDARIDWYDDYTGLGCWLLYHHKYVKDDDCFKDFDT